MPLSFSQAEPDPHFEGLSIFLSASIPNASRWDGPFDPLEITDAVVSFARVALGAGARIVSAAHPTVAPLLLYVAAEMPRTNREQVTIYQSRLFEDVLPTATRRFEAEGIGSVIWTEAAASESPIPGEWDASLDLMRRQMLNESCPAAAVFIGGMGGITDEFDLFAGADPTRPTYPIGRPGGEARQLAERSESPLRERLVTSDVYPTLWRAVFADLRAQT